MAEKKVRVRIAPSPTGNLHVGTARAALFNELFARHEGGSFIVRIEDTDPARSKPEFEANIMEGFAWLGMSWQEGPDVGGEWGPYRQSERKQFYTAALQKLLDDGKAYKEGEAIKLNVESQEISFEDLVRGHVATQTDTFGGDFVIARSITDPLFHLAVVVDDALMGITHVIRGEDHLSNTAKHILLQQALGYSQPIYAHLPLLLDEKRAKLSKRKQETNLLAFRDMGFLPEAMVNYLALLGWNPGTEQEFFTHNQLAEAFSLDRVQKGGAIFSMVKLLAMNRHYIRALSAEELLQRFAQLLATNNTFTGKYNLTDTVYWVKAMATEQERIDTLVDLVEALEFYKPDKELEYSPELLIWKKSDAVKTAELLKKLAQKISEVPSEQFEKKTLEDTLMSWIDAEGLGRGDSLWPMRVALTGQQHSSGPFEVAAVLGKEETMRRLQLAQAKLEAL
jgi:glutamyl-tRNA synthetase